jgi:hypothetical protein
MPYREIIADFCNNGTEGINKLFRQKAGFCVGMAYG